MSVVEELLQNDPARVFIYIRLRRGISDAALARALEQNPFVTDIDLDLREEQRADWVSLLRVIATRANLEKVELLFARNAPAVLVHSILRAIQQNASIRSVDFQWVRLPTDISTFVDNASSITSFSIHNCDMEPAERQQGARNLAAALQRNTNIQTLKLSRLDDIYTTTIFNSLRSNNSLKTLIFHPQNLSDAASHAIQPLLEFTTSIQRFELHNVTFSEMQFLSIAQGITNSESVSELKLFNCHFQNRDSLAPLRSILQNKRNLTSLCLHHCSFGGGQVHEDIISFYRDRTHRYDALNSRLFFLRKLWKVCFREFSSRTCSRQSKRASCWNDSRLEALRLPTSCRPCCRAFH